MSNWGDCKRAAEETAEEVILDLEALLRVEPEHDFEMWADTAEHLKDILEQALREVDDHILVRERHLSGR